MKYFLDNCLPPRLAKALDALDDDSEVDHLRSKFPANTKDPVWIESLAKEGDWVIVTSDAIFRGQLEKEALRRSNLTAFFLAKGWGNIPFWEQVWKLVRWWPEITKQAAMVARGALFMVPVKFTAKFEQIKLK